ncbi:branched-chain amino acid ABC transporter permease [Pseudohalocynthiibacter sp. F2068]|uniref:branched-chain amino acid ABC transporter permease n=1 Tax=Pseudohalocynthiibacter sp. F2068 TaxID=2926418 RepID=UPI001FF23982|nr:branched-chain amino acid ABC transporter permease [Pseudohalocynthiibacter sp. F2068]MCK0103245.1 branched-chain amino acid ABC transporter permease [Pseudohalocynthiibacter sp. F2068]
MDYWYTIVSLACINVILAWSVYASFMTGTVSLGQAAFFGIGAFAGASMTAIYGWHIIPATLFGAGVGAAIGLVIAIPTLRLTGLYLTIATVAFVEVVRVVTHNMHYGREGTLAIQSSDAADVPWIGPDGPIGFRHITYLTDNGISPGEYAFALILVVIILGVLFFFLERSRFGYALRAVEADEIATQGIGLSHNLLKVIAFSAGAAIAAIGGSLYAHLLTFISGDDFGIPLTVMILAYVVIGGGQTFWGPLIGALLFTFLPEVVRFTKEYRLEIFGTAMLLAMLFRPQGLVTAALVKQITQKIFRRGSGHSDNHTATNSK